MSDERRVHDRKSIEPLSIQGLISISNLSPIADNASLVEASPTGFRLLVHRNDLANETLKENLTLDSIEGLEISLFIPAMDLDVTGMIVRTRHKGEGMFEVGIDYTSDAPQYWRECLCDLLPIPGELTN